MVVGGIVVGLGNREVLRHMRARRSHEADDVAEARSSVPKEDSASGCILDDALFIT